MHMLWHAGSEDINRSGATGVAAKEASHINKSLLTLGRVINALASNSPHIPYRESKLTRLLSEALGGVCKTTFIACVSPAASSQMESSSTLRYAKRASEALNISQLPRWQQDEILIEGLTRRVQILEAELASKDSVHAREMASMQSRMDSLRRDNAALVEHLGQAKAHLQQMCEQQLAARTALHAVTVHRDRLEAQKAALKSELLETRRVRDGYLADRTDLCSVLDSARVTRDALFTAYAQVESMLSHDCGDLKATIERALVEVSALHQEIARKRGISTHNEKAADLFCDQITTRFREVVQHMFAFRDAQTERHNAAVDALSQAVVDREEHGGEVHTALQSLQHATVGVLTGLAESVAAAEVTVKAHTLRQREDVRTFMDSLVQQLASLRDAAEAALVTSRSQCQQVSDAVGKWALTSRTKLDTIQAATSSFTSRVSTELSSLHTLVKASSDSQAARLQEHEKAIEAYRVNEVAALQAAAQRMIADITSHVSNVISDQALEATRRLERTASTLRDETQSIAGQVRETAKEHGLHVNLVTSTVTNFSESQAHEVRTLSALTSEASDAACAQLSVIQAGCKALGDDVTARIASANTKADAFTREYAERSLTGDAVVERATVTVKERVTESIVSSKAAVERICSSVSSATAQFQLAVADMHASADARMTEVQDHVDASCGECREHEAMSNEFVHTTLVRDTQPDPKQVAYTYPTEYASMKPYQEVIDSLK
ncbi:hypothetical protein EON68_00885, partial [archaeon]